jgi:hypothetical protein
MRPETIENILVTLHEGQWFGFNGEKVYANLWVADGYDKPTEEELNTLLTTKQTEYDNKQYQRDRAIAYPALAEQFDKLWHDINNGTLDNTGAFYTALKTVKDDNPKPGE